MWRFAGILSNSGVAYTDYVAQFTYLLFLKMDDEKSKTNATPSLIPQECRWENLLSYSGEDLENTYTHILSTLSRSNSKRINPLHLKSNQHIKSPR